MILAAYHNYTYVYHGGRISVYHAVTTNSLWCVSLALLKESTNFTLLINTLWDYPFLWSYRFTINRVTQIARYQRRVNQRRTTLSLSQSQPFVTVWRLSRALTGHLGTAPSVTSHAPAMSAQALYSSRLLKSYLDVSIVLQVVLDVINIAPISLIQVYSL